MMLRVGESLPRRWRLLLVLHFGTHSVRWTPSDLLPWHKIQPLLRGFQRMADALGVPYTTEVKPRGGRSP